MHKMILALTLFGLLASGPAYSKCPWGTRVESASATMTTVTVDGETFQVRGKNRVAFIETLRTCGEDEAARAFQRWRFYRRLTNATAVGGVFLLPLWAVTAGSAIAAHPAREQMIRELTAR